MVKIAVLGSTGPVGRSFAQGFGPRPHGHRAGAHALEDDPDAQEPQNCPGLPIKTTSPNCARAPTSSSRASASRRARHASWRRPPPTSGGQAQENHRRLEPRAVRLVAAHPVRVAANRRLAQSARRRARRRAGARSAWVCVRPAALGDGAGKGKYLATEATGASFAILPRDDVALFLADAARATTGTGRRCSCTRRGRRTVRKIHPSACHFSLAVAYNTRPRGLDHARKRSSSRGASPRPPSRRRRRRCRTAARAPSTASARARGTPGTSPARWCRRRAAACRRRAASPSRPRRSPRAPPPRRPPPRTASSGSP